MLVKALVLIATIVAGVIPATATQSQSPERGPRTKAVEGLPFCALVVAEMRNRPMSYRVYVLTEGKHVNETDLALLFSAVSSEYPREDLPLEMIVHSDVAEMKWMVTGYSGSGSAARGAKPRELDPTAGPWAYYWRTRDTEYYQYNPEYPAMGNRTVVLRGKPD